MTSRRRITFGHRVGNLNAAHAEAYPNHQPAPALEQVQDGFVCSICLCVLRTRTVHPGCKATEKDIDPRVVTKI